LIFYTAGKHGAPLISPIDLPMASLGIVMMQTLLE